MCWLDGLKPRDATHHRRFFLSIPALLGAANDDFGGCSGGRGSRVEFWATAGSTYGVMVAGYNAASGSYNLSWSYGVITPTATVTPSRTSNYQPACYRTRPGMSGSWTGTTAGSLDVGFGGSCNGVSYSTLTGEKLVIIQVPPTAPRNATLTIHTCVGTTWDTERE